MPRRAYPAAQARDGAFGAAAGAAGVLPGAAADQAVDAAAPVPATMTGAEPGLAGTSAGPGPAEPLRGAAAGYRAAAAQTAGSAAAGPTRTPHRSPLEVAHSEQADEISRPRGPLGEPGRAGAAATSGQADIWVGQAQKAQAPADHRTSQPPQQDSAAGSQPANATPPGSRGVPPEFAPPGRGVFRPSSRRRIAGVPPEFASRG